ncbi:MAG: tRNA (cytidine(34)-2'-O)-methyltransferase [Verrucomicrobiae bacterium]|nr:tRNA (cytidine(34)-2'-O)-methyltransferase [Verrucomicrobiae bacterium]
MFNVVLVEPEIPQNTGNIGRLCVATGCVLHLIRPLGFELDAASLRRAGMDYWDKLKYLDWPSLPAYLQSLSSAAAARCFYFSTKAARAYWDATFEPGDSLIFGRETRGLPENLIRTAGESGRALRIPMPGPAEARSLNLAVSVGVAVYEALRQCTGTPLGHSPGP